MPKQRYVIGSPSAIYVNDWQSAQDFRKILSVPTGPVIITDAIPEQYEPSVDNSVQSGYRTLNINMSFYFDPGDPVPLLMARGVYINGVSETDQPSDFAQYELVILSTEEDTPTSIYLPKCYTIKTVGLEFFKSTVTKIDIQLTALNRNRFKPLLYIDTPDNLAIRLDDRSPF